MRSLFSRLIVCSSIMLAACGTPQQANNDPLDVPIASHQNYSLENWIDRQGKRETLILLSFSGGGVRATALAASVLEQLGELGLSDQIAVISSTSGGSVAAGFYAAYGQEKLRSLRTRLLEKNNNGALAGPALRSFLMTGKNRSQEFADYLDRILLSPHKGDPVWDYEALMQRWPKAPYIILNATEVSTGFTFELTQQYFSYLCSDLNSFRLSEAIAASSSFPIMLTPIPLKNHWRQSCEELIPEDTSYATAYENRFLDLEKFVRARHVRSLRYSYDDSKQPYRKFQYIHLIDGGLSDNLGARALLRAFSPEILSKLLDKGLKNIVLIQVNAKTEVPRSRLDSSAEAPSLADIYKSVADNPLDLTTSLSAYLSKRYWTQLVDSAKLPSGSEDSELRFFPVQVDFDLIADPAQQWRAKRIGTDWTLKEDELRLLDGLGKAQLDQHPCFQAFLLRVKHKAASERASGCKTVGVDGSSVRNAYAPTPPPAPPAPVTTPPPAPPRFEKITLAATELFDLGDAKLRLPSARLESIAAQLREEGSSLIYIIGHTDRLGDAGANLRLSEKRALAAKAYLVQHGIDPERLHISARGASEPVVDCPALHGDELINCLEPNRRVEIEAVIERRVQ